MVFKLYSYLNNIIKIMLKDSNNDYGNISNSQ